MNFDFCMPVRLITGRGCIAANQKEFAALGDRCIIVTSGSAAKKSGALADVVAALDAGSVVYTVYDRVEPNPSLVGSKEAGDLARAFGAEFVVGIGGGSALDAAKACTVFAANDIAPMDIYQLDWQNPALPLIAVGTTAGTGSEVAPYAVMTTPDGKKKSFSSRQCYAQVAFGDAKYTDSLPLRFTVSTALDALSHALEGYYSTSANGLSDLFAREAVRVLYPRLKELAEIQDVAEITPELRDQLYYASILAGVTLAQCGTCYCHSMGYFLTEEHDVPHGTACAVFLAHFTQRAGRLMPEKAAALFSHAACSQQELCTLIEAMHNCPRVIICGRKTEELVESYKGVGNFTRTAPAGFSMEEASALLTQMFGA